MNLGKGAYLDRLSTGMNMRSVHVGKELVGSSPPSVFIGRYGYPKVLAGPMLAPVPGDTSRMDAPESWIPSHISQEEIIGYRMNLVRGTQRIGIHELENPFVEKLREISLSSTSIESEAAFCSTPTGRTFSEEYIPFGPSAPIERLDISNTSWNRDLERVYYDTDLKAADAIPALHTKDVPFSSIQKALSVGVMGRGRERRLVPTRWSITATDTIIGENLLREIRQFQMIDSFRVHEFESLHNNYSVLLLPTGWQYEWMEAFIHVLGTEELLFTDYEGHCGKTGYSSVGGCYYSSKMAVLEALHREERQAGAIIFREAHRGYVPLGVFNVRENVRNAMLQPPHEFEDIKTALSYIVKKLTLPFSRFVGDSHLLRSIVRSGQMTLHSFGI